MEYIVNNNLLNLERNELLGYIALLIASRFFEGVKFFVRHNMTENTAFSRFAKVEVETSVLKNLTASLQQLLRKVSGHIFRTKLHAVRNILACSLEISLISS